MLHNVSCLFIRDEIEHNTDDICRQCWSINKYLTSTIPVDPESHMLNFFLAEIIAAAATTTAVAAVNFQCRQ